MIHYVDVPHYSQITDIPAVVQGLAPKNWQKEGCGIAAMAMLIEFSKSETDTSVPKLLTQAVTSGAYVPNVGWSHIGLAQLASKYGLAGKTHDLTGLTKSAAFEELENILEGGPVIASIHMHFNPNVRMGHLVVITGFDNEFVYYNDPGFSLKTERKISHDGFKAGWKKRVISVRMPNVEIVKFTPPTVSYNVPDSPLI